MKKFAANYMVSDGGQLLKNGIVITDDDGFVAELIDTRGDLDEMDRLIFLNGILLPECLYFRNLQEEMKNDQEDLPGQFILQLMSRLDQLSANQIFDIAQQVQFQFPDRTIAEIFIAIYSFLDTYFIRKKSSGLFLIIGSDLVPLHFTERSRLKKIV